MADTAENPLDMLHRLRARLSEEAAPLGLEDIGCDLKLGRGGEKDVMIVAFAINAEVLNVDAAEVAANAAAEAEVEAFRREVQAEDLTRQEALAVEAAEAVRARLEAAEAEENAQVIADLERALRPPKES